MEEEIVSRRKKFVFEAANLFSKRRKSAIESISKRSVSIYTSPWTSVNANILIT